MLIDVHVHIGTGTVADMSISEEDILRTWDEAGIDSGIVQPTTQRVNIEAQRAAHDRIYRFAKDNPGRVYGMVNLNPHLPPQQYHDEAKRCIEELGFVGIKLLTVSTSCSPISPDGLMVFKTCREFGVPIMVHTGSGVPFSLPSLCIAPARQFPDVKVVLAHSGMVIYVDEAILAADLCPNIYLETSLTPNHVIRKILKTVSPKRLLFASDLLEDASTDVFKWKAVPMSDADREWPMWRTAADVYRLPAPAPAGHD